MIELVETLFATASLWRIIDLLAEMTVTDVMVVFLLSKPLFVAAAFGAMFAGHRAGGDHYLHRVDRSASPIAPLSAD